LTTVHLSENRLQELIDRFRSCRIAVVGDFFLDKYIEVDPDLEELSIETAKPAHQVVAIRTSPGAAGTVINNLAALGAGMLYAVGFTGEDGEGYDLRKGLHHLGCNTDHLHGVPNRYTPTYLKPRNLRDATLAGEHSRYDTKNHDPTTDETQKKVIRSVDALLADVDAVMIMDQVEEPGCGVVTRAVREALAQRASAHSEVVFWADSRRRIRDFRNVIIKPNQFEAVGVENPAPDDDVPLDQLRAAVGRLREQNDAPVVATRGAQGMVVSDPEWTIVPGVHVDGPIDPTGAGDSASAGAILGLCAGAELPEAAVVGNLVASITVQQIASTGVARPDQLAPRLQLWQQQTSD